MHPPSPPPPKLKEFLKVEGLSTIGNKSELVRRVSDFIETEELESELSVVTFSIY